MEAGRALDAKVAEEVMNAGMTVIVQKDGELLGLDMDTEGWEVVPHYSTDIAAAWKVVDAIKARDSASHGFFVSWRSADHWGRNPACWVAGFIYTADGGGDDYTWEGSGETAPLAICRAALAAVGAEVPA